MTDHAHERLVDGLLAHLEKDGDDDRIREIAGGIRNGEVSLKQVMSASFYAEALQPRLDGFTGWYQQLSNAERTAEAGRLQAELDLIKDTARLDDE